MQQNIKENKQETDLLVKKKLLKIDLCFKNLEDSKKRWHQPVSIVINEKINLLLTETPTGCGLGSLNNTNLLLNLNKKQLKEVKEFLLNINFKIREAKKGFGMLPYGAILTVCGDYFVKELEPLLIKDLGFKQMTVYNNLAHGKDYKQRIYLLQLKK